MKHFLEISLLSKTDMESLLQRAFHFKHHKAYPKYPHITVAPLFYENSTRTRVSFELAAQRLHMEVVHLNVQTSSEQKGESILDTIHTLAAMDIQLFIIRHGQDGLPKALAEQCPGIHIVNGGDGMHAHPSQAMLDVMTIFEQKSNIPDLKIAIVGDILHSRVAKSLQCAFSTWGVGELVLVAPPIWQPAKAHYGRITASLEEGLTDADVVICLRVQKERLLADDLYDLQRYRQEYAITTQTLAVAKPDVMIMHPGPMNRGLEIDAQVADGPRSFILQQVQNGVFMRMAILEALVQGF